MWFVPARWVIWDAPTFSAPGVSNPKLLTKLTSTKLTLAPRPAFSRSTIVQVTRQGKAGSPVGWATGEDGVMSTATTALAAAGGAGGAAGAAGVPPPPPPQPVSRTVTVMA